MIIKNISIKLEKIGRYTNIIKIFSLSPDYRGDLQPSIDVYFNNRMYLSKCLFVGTFCTSYKKIDTDIKLKANEFYELI